MRKASESNRTVAQLQQAVLIYRAVTAGRRPIQAHTVGAQVIHPHQVPRQLSLERSPAPVVAQVPQHIGQSVITQIAHLQRGLATAPQRVQATFGPRLHAIHAVVGLREEMRQPDRRHHTQAQPLAVAVRREVLVQQAGYAHALHLSQQQRDVIDPLCPNRQWFIHFNSVSESWDCVQIYANRELILYCFSLLNFPLNRI